MLPILGGKAMGDMTKAFKGNKGFEAALAFVQEQANKLEKKRGVGSFAAAKKACEAAKSNTHVKECAALEWIVKITLDHGDFEKLIVLSSTTSKQLFAHSR
jgi:hypothetical protein